MTEAYKRYEDALADWADDPRSLEGAQALDMLNPTSTGETTLNLYASREFVQTGYEDPRAVAEMAAKREARRPDRLFEPGAIVGRPMKEGQEYSV